MGRLFGTDGIRGIALREPITPKTAHKIGCAVVELFKRKGRESRIVIGRDTRESGKILERGLVSGVLSLGAEAILVGVLSTPGVAFITREIGADAGIVISASHNPYKYNGFKIFSHGGYKLSDKMESKIEDLVSKDIFPAQRQIREGTGQAGQMDKAGERYLSFLESTVSEGFTLGNRKIVLDCAHGATYHLAPALFERMGGRVESLSVSPDGKNINDHCGALYPQILSASVVESGSDLGFAFDGDGDRLVAVDEKGNVLTGDQVLLICAKTLKDRGHLTNNLVVSTVMSNMGFHAALEGLGISHVTTRVGDRYVLEAMRGKGAILGGEESGHIVFLRHHTTGDGLLSALQLSEAIVTWGQPLSKLSGLMAVFPRAVINVTVREKPEISSIPELVYLLQEVERKLGRRGKVLVRYSGTEPVCRIMVEGEGKEEVESYAREIADVVRQKLGEHHSNSSDSSVG